jgi:nucleotide-binding universal stress UspA family protein
MTSTSAPERQQGAAQEAVAELARSFRLTCPNCQRMVLTGEPTDQIAQLARDLKADLIITASHHPSYLRRLFNLDHAPQIMRRAPCAVLVYYEKEEWV